MPVAAIQDFPNLALEAVKAGNAVEADIYKKIRACLEEAQGYQKQIRELLDVKKTLSSKNEGAILSKEELQRLKDSGLALDGYEKALTKEQISTLKELADNEIDHRKAEAEIIYTTKISPKQQNLQTIWSALQAIIADHRRLLEKISQAPK